MKTLANELWCRERVKPVHLFHLHAGASLESVGKLLLEGMKEMLAKAASASSSFGFG